MALAFAACRLHAKDARVVPVAVAVAAVPEFDARRAYDLGSLLELGMAINPRTRAAWFRATGAGAAVGEARAPYFPKAGMEIQVGVDKWYTPASNAPDDFTRQQATTVLSLEYLLLDFGRRAADVSRAVALFDAAGLAFERKVQEVVFAIQSRYFAHEAAVEKHRAAESMLEFARTAAATIKREAGTGLSAAPDLLRVQKDVLDAEYEVVAAVALVRTTLGDLCVAAGLPANTPLKLAPISSDFPAADRVARTGPLVEKALALRPDLAARAADVRASEAATRRARSDFLPEVSLQGSYAYSAFQYSASAGTNGGTFGQGLNGYGAFLNVKWDIFDGFERVEKLRRRRAEEQAAREELESSRLEATRDVWTAYHDTLSAARRVDYAQGLVVSAQENWNAMRAAYQNGLSPIADLAEAAGQLAEARSSRATAIAEYSTALASLALAVGQ